MSDEFTDENDNSGDGIKNLRKQFEAQAKQLKEAQDLIDKFQKEQRQSSLAQIFKAKGISEKAARFYDGEDASEEGVNKWLTENADVFGIKPAEQAAEAAKPDPNAEQAAKAAQFVWGSQESPSKSEGGTITGDLNEIANAINTLPYDELVNMGLMPPQGTLMNPNRR